MIRVDLVNMICVDTFCDNPRMTEKNGRLREARKGAGFRSAMAAAKRFNWPPSSYAAHENGQNGYSVDNAETYARAFKVSLGWLLTGSGESVRANIVQVAGVVSAGGQILTGAEDVGHDALDEIEVPFPLPDDAAAYRVNGDSMFPRYDDGDVIIVRKRPRTPEDLLNFESMVTTTDGDRFLKRIVAGSKKGAFDLESFNAPVMRNIKISNAIEIHAVVRRGQWKSLDTAGKRRIVRRAIDRVR